MNSTNSPPPAYVDPYPLPSPPTGSENLIQLIRNKGIEIMPIMYPRLTPAEVNALWDNFGNANPAIRQAFVINNNRLLTEYPAETEENALFIINSGVTWLKNIASNIQENPLNPTRSFSGGRKRKSRRR